MKLKYYEIEVLGHIYKIIYYVCISTLHLYACIVYEKYKCKSYIITTYDNI